MGTPATIPRTNARGLHGLAMLEAAKGLVVILAGFGLLALIHRDLQATAELLVARLHLNPATYLGRFFIETAGEMTDDRLRCLALLTLLYSALCLVKAYGLWYGRRWAEWFAVISSGIYLPIELAELGRGFSWLKLGSLVINLGIVVYLIRVLRAQRAAAAAAEGAVGRARGGAEAGG